MSTLDVVFSHYVCYILVGTYFDLQDTSETGNLKGDMNIYTKTFHGNQSVPRAPMAFIFKIFLTKQHTLDEAQCHNYSTETAVCGNQDRNVLKGTV